jgi:hypothetical protein
MKMSSRWPTVLGCLPVAAAIIISTGCAATSRQPTASARPATATSPARAADQTPASAGTLLDSANLMTLARQEGYKPEVHGGAVIYCWTDAETGTTIPTRKCVNEDQMREMLLQNQQDRQDMQRNEASEKSCPGVAC